MKQFLTVGLALLAISVTSVTAEVTLKTTKVRDNIYMIEGVNGFAGGNVAASVGTDGILVVDSLLNGKTEQLMESLAKLSDTKTPPRYLLNTHWHGDHTGGNAALSGETPVIAHDNVRKRMMKDQKNYFGASPASPQAAWPVLTFNDQMTLYFNDEVVKLKHYPTGHTDGDSMIYFVKANVLHMGDEYFKGIYPFVDLTTGGSVVGLARNIAKVLNEMPKDVLIIPGHGTLSNLTELKAYHQMLETSIKVVKQGIKQGLSLADIQKKGLGEALASWGKGFIPEKDWISFTHGSITQQFSHSHGSSKTHHH